MTKGLFDACRSWLARLPGGLAVSSVVGCAGFAAVTGSSVACASAMGRIAIPEMIRNGYQPALATGTIAASGALGALIPPSILLILFGIFAEVPISHLFIGGIGIGILTTLMYIAIIVVRVSLNPALAPPVSVIPPLSERIEHLRATGPIIFLMVTVLGGMFTGWFTATEAGAVGALTSILIAWKTGKLSAAVLWDSITETLSTTGSLFIIAVGANLLTRFLALSGSGELITTFILNIQSSELMLIVGLALLYLFLGMFLDPLGAMLLTLPVILPVLDETGIDLIWFGVFLVKFLEIGMITPPIGLNVFVIKGVVGNLASLSTIFKGILWFLIADAIVVGLIVAFPQFITFLPSLMD